MSHRASFPQPDKNNEFWIETEQGWIYNTETENVAHNMTNADIEKFFQHYREGSHPECVNCPKEDPRTPEQKAQDADAADYDATIASLLP